MDEQEAERVGEERGRRTSAWFSWLLGLAVLATLVAFVKNHGEHEALAQSLRHVHPGWMVVALVCQLATYFADAAIFQNVLERAGVATRVVLFVPLGLAKLFLDQALPSGGISGTLLIVRALDRRGVPNEVTSAAVLVDLLGHYVAHAVLTIAAMGLYFAMGRLTPAVFVPAGLFALLAIFVPSLLVFIHRHGEKALPRFLSKLPLGSLFRAIGGARPDIVASRQLLLRATFLHVSILVLDGLTLVAMLVGIGVEPPLVPVLAAYVIATIVKIVGIVPGGIGTFEAASVALLTMVGVPLTPALTATLLYRGASFWIPLLPGLAFAQLEGRRRAS